MADTQKHPKGCAFKMVIVVKQSMQSNTLTFNKHYFIQFLFHIKLPTIRTNINKQKCVYISQDLMELFNTSSRRDLLNINLKKLKKSQLK